MILRRPAWLFVLLLTGVVAGGDSPQWRGPDRTGVSQEKGLLQEWPADGPPVRWIAKGIGTGYSTPAVAQGKIFLQTTVDKDEFALVLNEQDGTEIWRKEIGKIGENRGPQYPGTRSTPTVDGQHMYVLASDGELSCLAVADGQKIWSRNLVKDFDGKPGQWAYTESVLVDGDKVICTPGGEKAALAALNKKTGETIWISAIPDAGTAEYASIMVQGTGDTKEYVTFVRKGLVGVDAKTGRFLWSYDKTIDANANIVTPVIRGDRIFSGSGRNKGGTIELQRSGDQVTPKELYTATGMAVGLGGAVLVDGQLYGCTSQALFCADFETGKILWSERGVGTASLAYAGGRLYVRGHASGDVALVEPSADGYHEKGRLSQQERSKTQAWPYPVVANGGLLLRDQDVLVCYDVKAP